MPELPPATRVVHIGPPKTATTSVQSAFHHARDRIAQHGVRYVGAPQDRLRSTVKELESRGGQRQLPFESAVWKRICRKVAEAGGDRVVISMEMLSLARDGDVDRVLGDLGTGQPHVVVTLRPLTKVLPSHWQQCVRAGMSTPYDDWLTRILGDRATRTLWHRYRYDSLVERWASAAGADNVTVIVLDPTDRSMIFRTFESLVGLRGGTLRAVDGTSNRSLTVGEAEMARVLHQAYEEAGLPRHLQRRLLTVGALRYMRMHCQPSAVDTPSTATPLWAANRLAELDAEMAEKLPQTGVRIIGDISNLRTRSASRAAPETGESHPEPVVSATAAALAIVGALRQSGLDGTAEGRQGTP